MGHFEYAVPLDSVMTADQEIILTFHKYGYVQTQARVLVQNGIIDIGVIYLVPDNNDGVSTIAGKCYDFDGISDGATSTLHGEMTASLYKEHVVTPAPPNGEVIATQTVFTNGHYTFGELDAGAYTVLCEATDASGLTVDTARHAYASGSNTNNFRGVAAPSMMVGSNSILVRIDWQVITTMPSHLRARCRLPVTLTGCAWWISCHSMDLPLCYQTWTFTPFLPPPTQTIVTCPT